MIEMKGVDGDPKEKLELIRLLMSARLFDNQEEIAEVCDEGLKWAQDFFHVKRGYMSQEGDYIENPDFKLLRIWISSQSGFFWDGTAWVETPQERARKRFG